MSFLRLAGKETAYFFQETKHAVNRLAEKTTATRNPNNTALHSPPSTAEQADVLPEVMRHSLPSKLFASPSESSTLSTASKWSLHSDPKNGFSSTVSPDVLNPLRAYVSLPQVTFGPKRWQLPSQEHSVIASTANEMRKDVYNPAPINSEKLRAAAEGLAHIGKAFAAATLIIFGGGTVVFGLVASSLELHNLDDIRTKGKDLAQPRFEMISEQLSPLRTWAKDMSKKWHLERKEDIKEKPIIKELSKILRAKSTS